MALAHPSDPRRPAPPSLARRHANRAPQTASGGLRQATQLRARRNASQTLAASGKNRFRYDRPRRAALLRQSNTVAEVVVTAQRKYAQEEVEPFPRLTVPPDWEGPPQLPDIPFPSHPTKSPGPGWIWRGAGPPGTRGNWINPKTGERLNPDLDHPPGVDPHYDYTRPGQPDIRWFPNGSWGFKSFSACLTAGYCA